MSLVRRIESIEISHFKRYLARLFLYRYHGTSVRASGEIKKVLPCVYSARGNLNRDFDV